MALSVVVGCGVERGYRGHTSDSVVLVVRRSESAIRPRTPARPARDDGFRWGEEGENLEEDELNVREQSWFFVLPLFRIRSPENIRTEIVMPIQRLFSGNCPDTAYLAERNLTP